MVKIYIPFEYAPRGQPAGETVWATSLGNDQYRLENEPLNEELSHGDVITAVQDETGYLTMSFEE